MRSIRLFVVVVLLAAVGTSVNTSFAGASADAYATLRLEDPANDAWGTFLFEPGPAPSPGVSCPRTDLRAVTLEQDPVRGARVTIEVENFATPCVPVVGDPEMVLFLVDYPAKGCAQNTIWFRVESTGRAFSTLMRSDCEDGSSSAPNGRWWGTVEGSVLRSDWMGAAPVPADGPLGVVSTLYKTGCAAPCGSGGGPFMDRAGAADMWSG